MNRDDFGKAAFAMIGIAALLVYLVFNPIVLHPRSAGLSVFLRSTAIDATILVCAIGLIRVRRWAALFACAAAVYVAVEFARIGSVLSSLLFLTPVIVTLVFWPALVPADKRRDPLYVFGAIGIAVLVNAIGFRILRH